MSFMELTPVIVPTDWTPEKDFAFFEERFDEPRGDYFSAALDRVAQDYQELIDAADSALRYFEQHDHRLVTVHPATLTLAEKLMRLAIITNGRNATYEYKARFLERLHNAQWADQERRRVMESYYIKEERTWLYSLCELADCLGCAAMQLEEGMRCEHADYRAPES
jgi:deoxyribodipyrimidine photolyase-like uncharacterized protein